MICYELYCQIRLLHQERGLNFAQIARELNLDEETVGRCIRVGRSKPCGKREDTILAERSAKHINVNILRYFSEPATLDDEAKAFLQRGMTLAMEWAMQGLVVPHIGRTIDSTVEAINAGLQSLKAGTGGKLRCARERVAGGGPRLLTRIALDARRQKRSSAGSSPPGRSGIGRRHELFPFLHIRCRKR